MGHPLRTLHIVGHLDFGGGERRLSLIVEGLRQRGHQPVVVCLHHGGHYADLLRATGIRVVELRARRWRDALHVPQFAQTMREVRPHLVDCHMSNAIWFGTLANMIGGRRPIIASLYNLSTWSIRWRRQLDIACLRAAAFSIVDSEQLREELIARAGLRPETVGTVYTGIPDPLKADAPPTPEMVRRELGIPLGRRVVGMVARFETHKGHTCLARAMPTVLRRHPDAHFLMVGPDQDPTVRRSVAKLAQENVVQDRLTMCSYGGPISAVHDLLSVYVLPSSSESIPLAIIEAMAAGRPVIATAVGGIPELVQTDRTGILIAPGDADGLADSICRVLGDDDYRQRLGAAARLMFETKFSDDAMTRDIEKRFETVIEQHNGTIERG